MDTQEFRNVAHQFVDWMADYLETVESYPVRAEVSPGEIAAKLPPHAPEEPEPMARIFADFQELILPGITHWQHPSFFAYFPANSSPPSVLAEMLTATLGVQGMVWQTSPAATELETRVLAWLGELIGLPRGFQGVIQDSASTATLCALLAARERATGFAANEEGLRAVERLTVYASQQANSSIEKDVKIAGLGRANLRLIEGDETLAMRPEALQAAIAADRAAGFRPTCVIATLGTTGTGAIDPLGPIGEICAAHDVWLHVDAAWAGSALVLPEHRAMLEGIERADSFVLNPHKWLFTNFDCSAFYVRDVAGYVRSLEIQPAYLRTREDAAVINYRDWSVPLGRRFRALKLWFVLRSYGARGLRERIARHIALAEALEGEIAAADDFELLTPRSLALLCFRYHPAGIDAPAALDALNGEILARLNDSGALYLSPGSVRGAAALRLSIGQTGTEARHVEAAWRRIQETARGLEAPALAEGGAG